MPSPKTVSSTSTSGRWPEHAALFLICWQLIERYKLENQRFAITRRAEQCVPENAVKPVQGEKVVIVVDGLDEVDLDAQRGDDSMSVRPGSAQGVYFLLTSRRYVEKLGGASSSIPVGKVKLEDFAESGGH